MTTRSLEKWQIISFLSRGFAMALGLVQSFVILRILTQSQWGIVQLAISIGGALGIYQHLGLASASTKEISQTKSDTEIFKIFITSVVIRYCVTLPLAVGLFFLSDHIANNIYKHADLALPLKIYAATLLFQGFQSILNSVISGTKRFKRLFIYQVFIAFISVLIYVPFVYFLKIEGYFYALFLFNLVSTAVLSVLAFAPLRGKMQMPSRSDFSVLFKQIFTISMAIYFVKVIYTNWEKFGANILGLYNTAEVVAIYGFALVFAKKIMSISDAVTDVNLPVLSEKFVNDIKDFKNTFSSNFNKIFAFTILSASAASFWAPQIIYLLAGEEKYFEYYDSLRLISPLLIAFILYSFINIIKSSILIPAKLTKEMSLSFILLIVLTALPFGIFYYTGIFTPTFSMAVAMAIGALFSFIYINKAVKKKLNYVFFNIDHSLVLVQSIFIGIVSGVDSILIKSISFVMLMTLLVSGVLVSKFITKEELLFVKNKFLKKA